MALGTTPYKYFGYSLSFTPAPRAKHAQKHSPGGPRHHAVNNSWDHREATLK